MSKFLNIPNGNYQIQVEHGGQITLNTGPEMGRVWVTGDLYVQGNTTTVQSEDLTVRDNIIVVNSGETGSGVTLNEAGIRIDRGVYPDTTFVFDEDISWYAGGNSYNGAFAFKTTAATNSGLVGIRTNSINTAGSNLYLINSGVGVISVEGTINYESRVIDDDHVPNKKYVDDSIVTAFANTLLKQIGDGIITPTTVRARDTETTGLPSNVEVAIDTVPVATFYEDRLELSDVRIVGTRIETISSNDDLILSAPGTGVVVVDDTLEIKNLLNQPYPDNADSNPASSIDGLKLYVRDQGVGGSGLFFVNHQTTRDEIISNNRSLIYSMIF